MLEKEFYKFKTELMRWVVRIISNKAKCKKCGEIVISYQENEYVRCQCGAIAVAGGVKSIMRLGHHNDILEMSEKEYE